MQRNAHLLNNRRIVAAVAAGAGAVAYAAHNHEKKKAEDGQRTGAGFGKATGRKYVDAQPEYRNTELGKDARNSKGIYYSSGNYEAFARPRKPEGVDEKHAYLVGSGLASLAAACFLVRDGQMPGDHIHILEAMDLGTILHTGKKKSNLQKRRNDKNFIISPFLIKDTIQNSILFRRSTVPPGNLFKIMDGVCNIPVQRNAHLLDDRRIVFFHPAVDTWQEGMLQIFEAVTENRQFIMNVYRAVERSKLAES